MRNRRIIAFLLTLLLSLGTFVPITSSDVYATQGTKFTVGKDNNNFAHNNGEKGGFKGYNTYYISNNHFAKLLNLASYSEKVKLIVKRNKTWGGSCHGVATTMALVKRGVYSAADLSSRGASNYYSIGKPCGDLRFMSWINFYQLIQNIDMYSCSSYASAKWPVWNDGHSYNNLGDFIYSLRKFGDAAEEMGDVSVLSYFYNGANTSYGHSILITGYRESNGTQIVELYDENNSKKIDMTTRIDDNWFEFVDGLGNTITPLTCTGMFIGEPVTIYGMSSLGLMEVDDSTKLSFDTSDSFELVDGNGKTLKIEKGEISGDLPVSDVDYYVCDEDSELIVKTSSIDSATITNLGDSLSVELYDDSEFRSVEGESIGTVRFGDDGKIKITGNDYSFKAFIGVESSDNYDVAAGSISAKATGAVRIESDSQKVTAESDNKMTDIEVGIYKDENGKIEQQDDSKKSIITITEQPSSDGGSSGGGAPSGGGGAGGGGGAEASDDQAVADAAIAVINKIPAMVTIKDKAAIEAARAAYDALSAEQKALVGKEILAKLEKAEAAIRSAEAVKAVEDAIDELPDAIAVTTADKVAIEAAQAAYDALSADEKTSFSADKKAKLDAAIEALTKAELNEASNINKTTVTNADIRKAAELGATTITLGSRVKKISAKAFNGTGIKTIVVKTKKLTAKKVKGSLKGSKVKTVKVKVGSKNTNKKYVKKYKKIFTKKIAGKKVAVK